MHEDDHLEAQYEERTHLEDTGGDEEPLDDEDFDSPFPFYEVDIDE